MKKFLLNSLFCIPSDISPNNQSRTYQAFGHYSLSCVARQIKFAKASSSSGFVTVFKDIRRDPWTGDRPIARSLPAHKKTCWEKSTHIPGMEIEPMIWMYELLCSGRVLDHEFRVVDAKRSLLTVYEKYGVNSPNFCLAFSAKYFIWTGMKAGDSVHVHIKFFARTTKCIIYIIYFTST